MIKNYFRVSLLLLLLGTVSQTSSAIVVPLGIHPFEFVYQNIERNETLNQDTFFYPVAPYLLDTTYALPASLSFLKTSEKKINYFLIGNESFQTNSFQTPTYYEILRGGFTGKLSSHISIYANISLDETKAKDITYTGKKWRGLAGGVEQSFVTATYNNFTLHAGRFASFWGIQKSILLAGSNALDGFQYTFHYRKISLTYRFAKLNQLQTDLQTSEFDNRYFVGHRLDFRLHKNLKFGIFESIIFGGVGRTAEFNYLNPLMSYHVEQLNNNVNDNSFIGGDFVYYPKQNMKLYGQLIIDDFQIDDKTQGDQEPNEYGLILGSYLVNIFPSYDLRVEYIKITNRTYNQAYERNRYTFENISLGYFNENDFDKTNFFVTKWLSQTSLVALNFSYKRKGEGNINDNWTEPWLDTNDPYTESFPFGVVEKTTHLSGQFKGFLYKNFYLDTELGIESIQNRNNIKADSEQNSFIHISLHAFFSGQL